MSQALAAIPAGRAHIPKKTPEIAALASSLRVTQRNGGNKIAARTVTPAEQAKIGVAIKAHQSGQKANRFAGIFPQAVVPQDLPDDGTVPPPDQAPVDPTYTTSQLYQPIDGEVADFFTCFWTAPDDFTWSMVNSHISACSKQAYQVINCLNLSCSETEMAYYGSVLVGKAWKANDGSTPTDIVWEEYLWPLDSLVTVSAGTLILGVNCGSAPSSSNTWSSCESMSGVQAASVTDINAADEFNPYEVTHRVRFTPDARDGDTDQVLTYWSTQHFAYISGFGSTTSAMTYVRCDNSPYFSGGPACVFDADVSQFSRLNIYNDDIDEMAWHVASAMWLDENMPGRDSTNPLNRDKTNASAARVLARARCASNFPDEYADGAYQCDEYPFASTAQNAASYSGFSVEEISAGDNQIGGWYLAGWYFSQRIIKGDAFTVYVLTIG